MNDDKADELIKCLRYISYILIFIAGLLTSMALR